MPSVIAFVEIVSHDCLQCNDVFSNTDNPRQLHRGTVQFHKPNAPSGLYLSKKIHLWMGDNKK